jgi:hypothetical protein
VWKPEKNQPRIGANPPYGREKSDLLFLTLAIQLRCLARPFIGNVRANPVGAPAPPLRGMLDVFIFEIFFIGIDKSLPLKFSLLAEIE